MGGHESCFKEERIMGKVSRNLSGTPWHIERGQVSEITQIALLMFKDAVLALFLVIIIMYVSEKSHVKNLNMECQREQAVNLFDLVKIHNKRRARIIRLSGEFALK